MERRAPLQQRSTTCDGSAGNWGQSTPAIDRMHAAQAVPAPPTRTTRRECVVAPRAPRAARAASEIPTKQARQEARNCRGVVRTGARLQALTSAQQLVLCSPGLAATARDPGHSGATNSNGTSVRTPSLARTAREASEKARFRSGGCGVMGAPRKPAQTLRTAAAPFPSLARNFKTQRSSIDFCTGTSRNARLSPLSNRCENRIRVTQVPGWHAPSGHSHDGGTAA